MRPASREAQLLRGATAAAEALAAQVAAPRRQELRFQVLEAAASRFGGFDLARYWRSFATSPCADVAAIGEAARYVEAEILASGIPPALAVSALARVGLDTAAQRRAGAYHTDFRLAQHLAASLAETFRPGMRVIDPACGSGILLAAVVLAARDCGRCPTDPLLSNGVFAADLSAAALRGAQIALACLTADVDTIVRMRGNWRVQDSLIDVDERWRAQADDGFDVVVANPPWEKIKITRHEFLQAEGVQRHYGASYEAIDASKYADRKSEAASYGAQLALRYPSLRSGEPDLYVAFTELLLCLARPGGSVGLLVPAGLIRSQNTERLRGLLFDQTSELSIQILDNRARFFEIDTRFKFLAVRGRKPLGRKRARPIRLAHAHGLPTGVDASPAVAIGRAELLVLRPDLSIPEVRSDAEWRLFARMVERGVDWAAEGSPWRPEFLREVDMTRDQRAFLRAKAGAALPVVEGRMVHQHRFGAKRHLGGTGRSAGWAINQPGASQLGPQYWINPSDLTPRAEYRTGQLRAGFCDITGQTNERSCLAAIVPPDVVCGNKVPTVTFPNDPREARLWLWVALVNSLPFDWMIRRIITTTINYFHLLSLPLPPVDPDSIPGWRLAGIARELATLDSAGASPTTHRRIAELRAKSDHLVLVALGLSTDDLDLMMRDFPLIDRAQPPLAGEGRSTVTRDLIIAQGRGDAATEARRRVELAIAAGAMAYMPSQVAAAEEGGLVDRLRLSSNAAAVEGFGPAP